MRKGLLSILFIFLLFFSMGTSVLAADPSAMTDISGHWAEENILWAMEQDLYNGVSETLFDPDGSMTRGMFVTVLGRMVGIREEDYMDWYLPNLYTDVDSGQYYAPYINWATRHGIAQGTGDGIFSPNAKITREQMAAFMVRFSHIYNYDLTPIPEQIVDSFSDLNEVSDYAVSYVQTMRAIGLLTGFLNPDGTYSFQPKANATRAECATVFRRLSESLTPSETVVIEADTIALLETELELYPGGKAALRARISPADASNATITWVSSNPSVAKVSRDGLITYAGPGTAEIYAYTCNGKSAVTNVICHTNYIASADESYAEKCSHIFGGHVDNPRGVYQTKEEAQANMVTIAIKVWDFADSSKTTKVTKTRYVTIHKNLAPTIAQVFDDIYQCKAQYPIHSVGGFGWRGTAKSEHCTGLALDINPAENYYCDPQGNALTGTHFDPENDPYSIPVGGEIEQIFNKYGFTRGIYWNNGYKDYMHFSFFGT